MPAAQREVVLARYAEDVNLMQIATALGIPLRTVKSRLHAALQVLREHDARSR